MAEYHFPVPGSENEKDIVIYVHRHWAAFLGQFFLSFFLLVIPIVILILIYIFNKNYLQGLAMNAIVLIFSVYYLIAITFAFISWVSFYYNVYIVTKDEIIEITQEGFFGRKIAQLSLLRVQDVTSHIKGLLPTFFAYGDVLVETAGEQSENFLLKDIPNPQEVSTQIMNLHGNLVKVEDREDQLLNGEGVLNNGNNRFSKPPSVSEAPIENKPASESPSSYQELLKKDQKESEEKEGEISKNDLDKGGEIDLK